MILRKEPNYFGEILIQQGRLDREKLHQALKLQRSSGSCALTGQILLDSGYIQEEDVMMGLSLQYGFPFLPLDEYEVDNSLINILPWELAHEHSLVPVEKQGNSLSIAMSNPLEWGVLKKIKSLTNCHVSVFISTKSAIRKKIDVLYARE